MHLLILDDEKDIGTLVARVAGGGGWSADIATDPDDFRTKFIAARPDAVVLDLALAASDGVEQLRYLHQSGYRSPIVLMSGFDSRVLDTARTLGASLGLQVAAALQKPLRVTTLRETLDGVKHRIATAQPQQARASAPRRSFDTAEITPARIDKAIAEDEMAIDLQPIVDAHTFEVHHFEALIRWHHPTAGLIMPGDFIAVAEHDQGVIDRLTRWVVGAAATAHVRLRAAGHPLPVAVNVSGKNLHMLDFPDQALRVVEAAGVSPAALAFEVTESVALHDVTATMDILARLRLKGFPLALDDLGAGYSSLKALRQLPFSELKIDRTFLMDADMSRDSLSIVRSVADLARNLRVRSVAEGVETQSTVDLLRGLGVDCLQGYVISRPLPQPKVLDWIAQWPSQVQQRLRPVATPG
jgi:EAL domain-containing protein (putative c-di-GMP-specific phosphodiesterase class I)